MRRSGTKWRLSTVATGQQDVDLRQRMVAITATPSSDPSRVLLALEAALVSHRAPLGVAAPQAGSSVRWPNLQCLLTKALPRLGGKLSEDDDGYYNIALSPQLKDKTRNSQQSYRGVFQESSDRKINLYEPGQQPVSGILQLMIELGGAELAVRRTRQAQPGLALEAFYSVHPSEASPRILQHVVSPHLTVTEKWMPGWDDEATVAAAEPQGWLPEAVDASLAALAKHRSDECGGAEVWLLHCGLLQGKA